MNHLPSLALLLTSLSAFAGTVDLSRDEFKMYRQYLNAIGDPRVQAMKPDARVPAIAKDAGFKLKELQSAIVRGDAAGDIQIKCQEGIQAAMGTSDLSGKVTHVEVDASRPHAVAYVSWANENLPNVEEEACLAASLATSGCPILSSVQVWANDKTNPKSRLFQALISSSAAEKIKPDKAKDFADTRYIRLFEKVKSLANGDDMTTAAAETGRL